MHYRVVVSTIGRDKQNGGNTRIYKNVEENDTKESLLAVFTGLFNQQSRIKSITAYKQDGVVVIDVDVMGRWSARRFTKRLFTRKVNRAADFNVLKLKMSTPDCSKYSKQTPVDYDFLLRYIFS